MPYYDATKTLELQIRDRMRDLLENDNEVKAVYNKPIYSFETNTVDASTDTRVSLVLSASDIRPAATQTHMLSVTYAIFTQKFSSTKRTGIDDEEVALDSLIRINGEIKRIIINKYQSDPTELSPNTPVRLWDSISFRQETAFLDITGGFQSLTYLLCNSYQRNN